MKINVVVPSFPTVMSGGYKIMFEYANRFAQTGDDVAVYFVMDVPLSRPVRPVPYLWLKSKWFGGRRPSWFALHERIACHSIFRLTDNAVRNADVLLFTQCLLTPPVGRLSEAKGRKINLIQGYEDWIAPSVGFLHETYRAVGIKNVVITDFLEEKVMAAGGMRPAKVYNAIDTGEFALRIPVEQRHAHTVSMLYHPLPKKGFEYGLEALRQCRAKYSDLSVSLFGVYPDPQLPEPWIRYTRSPRDLASLYNSTAIYVAPSLLEGWGLTATEAMSCGCALVATDIEAFKVFAHHGETALTAPAANAEKLAEAIDTLLADTELRQKLALKGHDYVQRFSWEKSVAALRKEMLAAQ